jgi:hypothetical protein
LLCSSAQGMPCETPTPVSAAKTLLILSAFIGVHRRLQNNIFYRR